VPVPAIEATYYTANGTVIMKATYDYVLFGSARLHDQSAVLERIAYSRPDGSYAGAVRFEPENSNWLNPIGRTTFVIVTTGGDLEFTRVTDYSWDSNTAAKRCRFLAGFRPEGEALAYSNLARGNMVSMHMISTRPSGEITADERVSYDLEYETNRLKSVRSNGVQWELQYEEYEVSE
jgi:hypothetical protein